MTDDELYSKRRDRSYSNEKFELPPLPDLDDNRDLNSGNGHEGFLSSNYQSNENTQSPSEKKELDPLKANESPELDDDFLMAMSNLSV